MGTRLGDSVCRFLSVTRSRRSALQRIGGGALGALAALNSRADATGTPAGGRMLPAHQRDARPNIILIVLDDMRADDLAMMPAVQELLVAQGTNFTSCFATAPTCAPARASILRGQYPHNHGVLRSNGDQGGYAPFYSRGHEHSTIATWLQDAGYHTGFIGKYLNGYPYDSQLPADVPPTHFPPGWHEWAGVTKEPYFKLEINENGEIKRYKNHYATDVLAAKALTFVAQMTRRARPFFLYLAPRAPHEPAEPAPRHASAFATRSAPRSPAFNEADLRDKPAWLQATPLLGEEEIASLDEAYVLRLRTLLAVDDLVAALVAALREAGSLKRTYLLLTSDNGYHLGEHRIAETKGSPYEEAIRVPLVVRGPAVPAGQSSAALASQVDLAPTLAAWAEAVVPDFVDGRSLAPLLAGDAPPTWRQTVLVELHGDRPEGSIKKPGFHALRAEDFIYIENATGEREYYDLIQDPDQLDNRAASLDAAQLAALSTRLAAMTGCAGETCRAIEDMSLPR